MNLKSIEVALRAYTASGQRDAEMTALLASLTSLEAQQQTADQKHAAASRTYADWQHQAEVGLAQGEAFDQSARQRLRKEVDDAEEAATLIARAIKRVQGDIDAATSARAERDTATLQPIFSELLALADERAEALVQVTDVLILAHTTANGVLPGASSELQQGYASLLTRERLEAWRTRVEQTGLLVKTSKQRVA